MMKNFTFNKPIRSNVTGMFSCIWHGGFLWKTCGWIYTPEDQHGTCPHGGLEDQFFFLNGWFVGSMLIFQGVYHTNGSFNIFNKSKESYPIPCFLPWHPIQRHSHTATGGTWLSTLTMKRRVVEQWKTNPLLPSIGIVTYLGSKKSPAGPTERTPTPEYLIALAISLGVRW